MELVVPGIGEIVKLDDPGAVALAMDAIRDLQSRLKEVNAELTDALVYHSKQWGGKTLHFEGGKVVIKGGKETEYDATEIEEGLREAGMPEERIRQIVKETTTYTVVAVEAKRAAATNPDYAKVIEAHSRTIEKRPYASISLAGS